MLFEGLLMLLFGFLLEKKSGPVRRRKIPYIIREGIISNPEYYRLNCLKSKQSMQRKQKNS
jgi:hypothetical protein